MNDDEQIPVQAQEHAADDKKNKQENEGSSSNNKADNKNDDNDVVIGGEAVPLTEVYSYGDENPEYQAQFTVTDEERVYVVMWFIIVMVVVGLFMFALAQRTQLREPTPLALAVVFGIPLGLLWRLSKSVPSAPTLRMMYNFLTAFLAAILLPLFAGIAAWLLTFIFDSSTLTVMVYAVFSVALVEFAKLYRMMTSDSRAKVRSAPDYIYLQLATAFGCAALECFGMVMTLNMGDSRSVSYDYSQPYRVIRTTWALYLCVIETTSHCLSSYLLGLAVSHRELNIVRNLESQIQSHHHQGTTTTPQVADEEVIAATTTATNNPDPQLPFAEYSELLRPFFTCVGMRLFVAMFLFTPDLFSVRMDVGSLLLMPLCLIPLLLFFKAAVDFQVRKLPASYLINTGYISCCGCIPLPSAHDSDEEDHTARREPADGMVVAGSPVT